MRKPRVLLIAPGLDILGGQSVQASRLLAILQQDPTIEIDFQQLAPNLPGPLNYLRRVKFIRTISTVLWFGCILLWKVPRYDILHVFTAAYTSYMFWALPSLAVAKLYGKKIVLNYRDGQAEDHLRNWKTALPTLKSMDLIVANSPFLVDVFAKFGLHIRAIWNIIDMDEFVHRKRRELRPVFLHNRILEPLYNIPCTLRAFQIVQRHYPGASLTVAHDGPSRRELEQLAADLKLKNTRFIGKVPHKSIAGLYDSADIYLTSPDFDCMPGSLLECYASGLPVVATACGGIPYIAIHEKTALLVPGGDHEAMAEAALRLLRDPGLVERITDEAFEWCKQFSAGPVQRQWVTLYHQLMAARSSGKETVSIPAD